MEKICFRIVFSARDQLRGRDDFVNESDAISFLRADDFSGENELERAASADKSRQTLRSATARDYSQFHFRLTELRVLRSDSNRACHRGFATATKRKAIHGRDHGLAEIFNQIEDILSKRARFLSFDGADLRELVDVGASDERFVAGSSQDHAAHGGVILRILESGF